MKEERGEERESKAIQPFFIHTVCYQSFDNLLTDDSIHVRRKSEVSLFPCSILNNFGPSLHIPNAQLKLKKNKEIERNF